MRELVNVREDRIPNPIDYVQMRRQTGGGLWGAMLIEHAHGDELPAELVGKRTLRVLNDTFADGMHLRNDICSYEKGAPRG